MPKVREERGGHLPHRDYIARVVTEPEAIERGPDAWSLEEGSVGVGPTLTPAYLAPGNSALMASPNTEVV
ncbi:hypothetical protein ACFV1W_40540 [Kitasatospora sp. NPDC059648]|uniref:hypothetical protein n=1 Tax=Kitasatospora sp. NPDC059648 TaxID=3346894 RepID=UPI0036C23314